jgi:hypothetical protein
MNESAFTHRLIRELKKQMPEAVIVKLNDRTTAGLPDFFVSLKHRVSWFEVKLVTNKRMLEPLQWETLRRLGGQYIIWDGREGSVNCVYQKFGMQDTGHWTISTVAFTKLVNEIVGYCNL